MEQYKISDEILNAFIDGEIESEEKIEILRQLGENPELTQRACELVRTKELLHAAYRSATPDDGGSRLQTGGRKGRSLRSGGWGALAASLLIGIVLINGPIMDSPAPLSPMAAQSGLGSGGYYSPVAFQQAEQDASMRIVFHLTTSDPLRMEKLLDDVQSLLQQTMELQQPAVVEVIANGDGLGMFRSDVSSFGERIHEMSSLNQNLRFVACQRTIDRLESGGEGKVHLLPDVIRAGSGISQVIQRQQQGWSYIQI